VVLVLNFILPRLAPGSYIDGMKDQTFLSPADRLALLQRFGLTQPIWVQFIIYLRESLLSFPPNFGTSFYFYPSTVWQVVSAYLPSTLFLITVSQLLAWTTGVLLGAWLGWNPNSKKNAALFATSSFVWGVPSYWLASILIFVLAIRIRLFPPALTGGLTSALTLSSIGVILDHSFLPILTLYILSFPVQALIMRNSMVGILQEDFMFAAVGRGLKKRSLILGHAARNAIMPSITNLALSFGTILAGAYLVEIVYSYPGMGYLIYTAVLNHDYPVLQGVFFFSAILVIGVNLMADISYTILDPRADYTEVRT
jgi:peptide/nickel transport system permease protein